MAMHYRTALLSMEEHIQAAQKALAGKQLTVKEAQEIVKEIHTCVQFAGAPLQVMIMGEFSTGKSSFINAMVGKRIAAVGALPTTAVITKLVYGDRECVIVRYRDGRAEEMFSPDRFEAFTDENRFTSAVAQQDIDYVEYHAPIPLLKIVEFIDSPGLNVVKAAHIDATQRFLRRADTVVWMLSVEEPLKDSELKAIDRLPKRLKPIVVLNKMDTIDEEEDDPETLVDAVRQKLREKVSAVIPVSAMLALEGQEKGDVTLLKAGGLSEFHAAMQAYAAKDKDEARLKTLLTSVVSVLLNMRQIQTEGKKKDGTEQYRWQMELSMLRPALLPVLSLAVSAFEADVFQNDEMKYLFYALYVSYEESYEAFEVRNKTRSYWEYSASLGGAYAKFYLGMWCDNNGNQAEAQKYLAGITWDDVTEAPYLNDNEEEAKEYYCEIRAALGVFYVFSNDEEKKEKGVPMILELADTYGNASAQAILGDLYANGHSVQQDYDEAERWYRKAAEQGAAKGQFGLGALYTEGNGVCLDFQEAAKWIRKAAEQGHVEAQCVLGCMYSDGKGVEQNDQEAAKWIRKAAEQGDADAQYVLGCMYSAGKGVEQNDQEAAKWTRKAAEQGDADAQYFLGDMYFRGKGVKQNYQEAARWYRKAAEQGHADAQNRLGEMFEYGRGVYQSNTEAQKWYAMAANNGHGEARENLARIQDLVRSHHEIQNSKRSSFCFITSAVCLSFGKSDDCYELTMFRRFRDTWLRAEPDGEALIAEYYRVAPAIVAKIEARDDAAVVYRGIWETYLAPCLTYLENKDYRACKALYVRMVESLQSEYR